MSHFINIVIILIFVSIIIAVQPAFAIGIDQLISV
ncbi:uncharacterized protein METZ01_LOCUS74780 [marine metagenome]|uniref:Uncharacterized protein n=1 Tax=marine metagenome TaxID=408172 RepID=A0A381U106_9ZZZZ